MSKGWVAPAGVGGGGWSSQGINALLGMAFSLVTFISPVGNLFVGTYLWKVGIAQAGFVSFLYASAASPQRVRLYARRDRFRGRRLPNSGGDTLFIAPGLQWITGGGRVLLEVSVQLPLFQDLRGSQPEADYDLLFGLRFAY